MGHILALYIEETLKRNEYYPVYISTPFFKITNHNLIHFIINFTALYENHILNISLSYLNVSSRTFGI